MSLPEFLEWMAIDARDPLPDRRMDWHWAAAAALDLNLHAKRRGSSQPWAAQEMRLFRDAWAAPPDEGSAAIADRRAAVARKFLAIVKRKPA